MNFLYGGGGGGMLGGGVGGKSAMASDSSFSLPLFGTRTKLQPRRLRALQHTQRDQQQHRSGSPSGAATVSSRDTDSGFLRTHIFMDLTSGSGKGAAAKSSAQYSQRSASLLDRLAALKVSRQSVRASDIGEASTNKVSNNGVTEIKMEQMVKKDSPEPEPLHLTSLDHLNEDCFIVPMHLVDRFLPAGHTLPSTLQRSSSQLQVRSCADTGVQVVIHVLDSLPARQPHTAGGGELDTGVDSASPRALVHTACEHALTAISRRRVTRSSVLLMNLEKSEHYPFLFYHTIERDCATVANSLQVIVECARQTLSPLYRGQSAEQAIHVYDEVATIARPPLSDKRAPITPSTGYIVSIFRVMSGEDRKCFEREWLGWTGARLLYKTIPACAGLRRIVMHKSTTTGVGQQTRVDSSGAAGAGGDRHVHYVLCCECSHMMNCLAETARGLPALRGRLIGYTGIYRPIQVT